MVNASCRPLSVARSKTPASQSLQSPDFISIQVGDLEASRAFDCTFPRTPPNTFDHTKPGETDQLWPPRYLKNPTIEFGKKKKSMHTGNNPRIS